MPEDLLLTYCRRICASLRSRINAEVYVNSDHSDLDIDIYWGEFQYQCTVSQMHKLVYRGVSSECIADYIYRSYKNSLLSEAFI